MNEEERTVEILKKCKQYVSDRRHRVQLDELIVSEANRLVEEISTAKFDLFDKWDTAEFIKQLEYCEDASKPLALMFGILGRWAEGELISNDVNNVLIFIQRALRDSKECSIWRNLRSYPAVLLLEAYGLALTRAGRWPEIHVLLNTRLSSGSDEPSRIVDELSLSSWHTIEKRGWQLLDGLEGRKTPLSDHVCEVMTEWTSDLMGIIPDFEELFDSWDVIASLVYSEKFEKVQNCDDASAEYATNWVPLGRVSWRVRSRLQTLHKIRHELSTPLLSAGFFSGDRNSLYRAIDNISAAADRRMWY